MHFVVLADDWTSDFSGYFFRQNVTFIRSQGGLSELTLELVFMQRRQPILRIDN